MQFRFTREDKLDIVLVDKFIVPEEEGTISGAGAEVCGRSQYAARIR